MNFKQAFMILLFHAFTTFISSNFIHKTFHVEKIFHSDMMQYFQAKIYTE